MSVGENIRVWRKEAGWTQQQLAEKAKISRGLVTAYEKNRATPPLEVLVRLAECLEVDLNTLVKGATKFSGNRERDILAITVDQAGRENVEFVNQKASAGYLTGYQDQEYIRDLPKLHLPFLPRNRTYRAFEIIGDSMLPIQPHSIVIGEFIENLEYLRNGDCCIVVTAQEGLTFKRVYNFSKEIGRILLVPDNTLYEPYLVKAVDVLEVWRKCKVIYDDVPTSNNITGKQLTSLILHIQEKILQSKSKQR